MAPPLWEASGRSEGRGTKNVKDLHTSSVEREKKSNSVKSQFFLLLDATPTEIGAESTIQTRFSVDIIILGFILANNLSNVIKTRPYSGSARSVGIDKCFLSDYLVLLEN